MDNSLAMETDPLGDTTPLPELSFDDLLDVSPIKKIIPSDDDDDTDPLNFNSQKRTHGLFTDDTLNTPVAKRKATVVSAVTALPNAFSYRSQTIPKTTLAEAAKASAKSPAAITTTTTTTTTKSTLAGAARVTTQAKQSNITTTTPSTNSSSNSSNGNNSNRSVVTTAKPATNQVLSAAAVQKIIGAAPTTTTTSSSGSGTSKTLPTGKMVIKTPSGQLIYLQNSRALQLKQLQGTTAAATTKPTVTVSAAASGSSTTTTSTAAAGNVGKKVAIQVIRTADNKLMPLKANVSGTTTQPTNKLSNTPMAGQKLMTLSPTVTQKIMTTGSGQMIVKPAAATTTIAGAASGAAAATTTTTTASNSAVTTNTVKTVTTSGTIISKVLPSTSVTSTTATAGSSVLAKKSAATDVTSSTTASSTKVTATVVEGKPNSHTTTSTANSSVTVTKVENKVFSTTAGKKFIVQGVNGKPIVVSNPQLLKFGTKTATTASTTTAVASTSTTAAKPIATSAAGKLHAIQLPGKRGVQYVRVLSASPSAATTKPATVAATKITTPITAAVATATATTTTQAKPTGGIVKIMNPNSTQPQKFSILRAASGNGGKLLVSTSAPKKDATITYSPISGKVQKTIVSVSSAGRSTATADNLIKTDANSATVSPNTINAMIKTIPASVKVTGISSNAAGTGLSLIRKHKISDLNAELQLATSDVDKCGPPNAKIAAKGERVVVISSSMLSNLKSKSENLIMQRLPGQDNDGQVRKVYSVLKNASGQTLKSYVLHPSSLLTQQHKTGASVNKLLTIKDQQQHQQQQKQLAVKLPVKPNKTEATTEIKLLPTTSVNDGSSSTITFRIKEETIEADGKCFTRPLTPPPDAAVGGVRRKHCNCSKSQCLKLYCDCFANGEFCQDCTCKDCFNTLHYEDERQRAIKNCLERNPSAFKPKITTARDQTDMRLHNKGCNCKRSGCLKNYCECYEAKIPCSSNCKCVGCRNIEERPDMDFDSAETMALIKNVATGTSADACTATVSGLKRSYDKIKSLDKYIEESIRMEKRDLGELSELDKSGIFEHRPKCNFITQDVIDASIQCMVWQAVECQNGTHNEQTVERMVMEELGRCLVEIIDFSINNSEANFTQD